MITCRSSRTALGLAACLALIGCGEGDTLSFLGSATSGPPASANALSQATLAGGAVTLRGTDAWCVEPRSLRNSARSSFALLAGCHELTQGRMAEASPRGYVSVSVGAAQVVAPSAEALLDDVLNGQGELVQSEATDVAIARVGPEEGQTVVALWRAAKVLDARPVLISVHGLPEGDLAGQTGRRLANQIADRMIANTAPPEPEPNAEAVADAQPLAAQEGGGGLDLRGLFGRLLN